MTIAAEAASQRNGVRTKLHGRAFYESIGSPKVILAPMVDQSEFAWRMLTRSFMPSGSSSNLLAYTPMFHSRLFADTQKYRESMFQPTKSTLPSPPDVYFQSQFPTSDFHLDGNPAIDRPLFVQFCSNDPDVLLEAARLVQPYCDAVDLNLGCPQGIAKKGHYGAFLQENWDLIYQLINRLHNGLDIPVTAKMRILETPEKTLEYAKTILSAGASIITVHGRQRHQKGHNTGIADWNVIRYLRENLPKDTVIFANGNILQHDDISKCLEATGADGVMSAEGNLHDPSIFAPPPPIGQEGREYWRGRDGKGGYRMDAVLRRYMDIIYKHVLDKPIPQRKPLFMPSDLPEAQTGPEGSKADDVQQSKQKHGKRHEPSPNLSAMQAHLFQLLRPLVTKHTYIRDALARSRGGDIAAFENVLDLVESAVKEGILEYEQAHIGDTSGVEEPKELTATHEYNPNSSSATIERVKRPWWICQPYVRPLPEEAIAKGAMTMSKKEQQRASKEDAVAKAVGIQPNGKIEKVGHGGSGEASIEVPKAGMVCG